MAGSTPASATDVRGLSPRANAPARPVPRTEAPRRGFLSRFTRNWIGLSGAIIVVLCVVVALVAPLLAPCGPEETHPNWQLFAPTEYVIFGTADFVRAC